MSQIFWLNLVALFFTSVIASALFLTVMGTGLKKPLNLAFALFALTVALSAITNILRHLSLWLDMGNPLLLSELNFLGGLLFGPLVLMFTALYLNRRSRWVDWGAGIGLVVIGVVCIPLFNHQLISDLHLDAFGIARSTTSSWRMAVIFIPVIFTGWSLLLFLLERHRVHSNYLVIGLVIFLGGYIINGALRPIFPVISVTTAISVAVLGYGVAQQQLFNPLKELTAELQQRINESEQTELALQEERNILRTLIDNLPDYIFVKDAQSRFVLNNAAHLEGLGVSSQEEVLGKTDLDVFPEEFAAQYYADEQQIIQSGEPLLDREEPIINQTTGEKGWVAVTKVPLRDNEGNITGLVGMSRDITQRKQAEAERERLQQQIIEAQQQTLQELSTPIIPVMDNIIIMPLVGMVDHMRAKDVTRSLLAGISQHKAKVVIIDITGVSMIDTDVVSHLNRTIQAAKLKGAHTIVTGISDIVAEAIVDLGLDWSQMTTLRDLQGGLRVALNQLGLKLNRV